MITDFVYAVAEVTISILGAATALHVGIDVIREFAR